jgi:DNA-binding PadR family transcriptional regulator
MVMKIAKKSSPNKTTQEMVISSPNLGYQTKKEHKKINERIVKDFLDIIILSQSKKGSITGYEIMTYVNENFDVMISPGTVYSTIYSLERQNFIVGNPVGEKRFYSLTETGQQQIGTYVSLKYDILDLIKNVIQ